MAPCDDGQYRWAVILAGGDGTRLRSLTQRISGDHRPKQFCPVIGGRTLLEETWDRAGRAVAPERTLVVVTRPHAPFYTPILERLGARHVVVQPENRGTAAGILYPLLRLAALAPAAAVAILPSDHHFSDEARFMSHVRAAFDALPDTPERVLLLGMIPDTHEAEYGWIEPGERLPGAARTGTCRVTRFWEKPRPALAEMLFARGCLWNSFVMVARVPALLALIRSATPGLANVFDTIRPALGTALEPAAAGALYAGLPSLDFSRDVLTARPWLLGVRPVTGVAWSDLGSPERVIRARQRLEQVAALAAS